MLVGWIVSKRYAKWVTKYFWGHIWLKYFCQIAEKNRNNYRGLRQELEDLTEAGVMMLYKVSVRENNQHHSILHHQQWSHLNNKNMFSLRAVMGLWCRSCQCRCCVTSWTRPGSSSPGRSRCRIIFMFSTWSSASSRQSSWVWWPGSEITRRWLMRSQTIPALSRILTLSLINWRIWWRLVNSYLDESSFVSNFQTSADWFNWHWINTFWTHLIKMFQFIDKTWTVDFTHWNSSWLHKWSCSGHCCWCSQG